MTPRDFAVLLRDGDPELFRFHTLRTAHAPYARVEHRRPHYVLKGRFRHPVEDDSLDRDDCNLV